MTNARQGQSFPLESIKAVIGGALVGGLVLPLLLGVLLQLTTGWRLPLSSWPPIAGLGALACGWISFKGAALKPAPALPNLGSARFAHDAEIDALKRREPNSLAIGWTPGDKADEMPLLYYSGPGHLLTIAPTRSGKGVGAIIPNLLTADRSVFVIDPKGENARITARRRRAFGPVFILDPFEVSGQAGAAFNPLALMSAESLDLAEDAATLADALVLDSGDAKDSHWNDEAKALISGIIMYVAASEKPEARNLDRVGVSESRDGKCGVRSGALISDLWRPDDDAGVLYWRFSTALRGVFANSDHWAILSKQAVMAFESRYSLRLYEIVALRSGLDHQTSETFDLETFRDRLGVPVGKLAEWADFRRKSLEPAIAEVNHLAGFTVSYEPIKHGRSVAAVKLSWGEKSSPERKATKRELDGSKVGRKARRVGTAETVVAEQPKLHAAFPAAGSISFGRWGELARANLPHPTPDVDLVASAFRKARAAAGRSFGGGDIEGHFVNFCKQWRSL